MKLENSCCVSMCVSGTPVSDTVCKRCPAGHFSSSDSSAEPCQPHRNCSHLGLKTLRWGSATSDSLCASQDKTAALDCSQHQALCRNGKRPDRTGRAVGGLRPGWGLRPQRAQIREGLGGIIYGTHRSRVGGSDHRGLRPPAAGGLRSLKAQNRGAQTLGGTDPGWGLRPRLRAQTQGTQI